MANTFQACPSCARHIKSEEALCPFCGSATPEGFGAIARPKGPAPLSRAAILFMSATAVTGVSAATACSSSSSGTGTTTDAGTDTGGPVAAYGPPPVMDSGQLDSGGPVAAYGPAIIDSGTDAAQDTGGPVAAYGPAPVDSGEG